KAEGKMEKLDSFASPRVLKELREQQPKFCLNRSFKVETRFPSGDNLTVFISNMNALFAAFSRLPVQGNESFNRALQAALLHAALEMVTGIKPGAVDWQISELTKDPNSGASLSKSP